MSLARRNKYEMIEVVRRAGLRAARQIKSSSVAPVLEFAKTVPGHQLVLKPQRSSGTNLVFRAADDAEIRHAFDQIMSTPTVYDEINTEVCAQEFLKGEEFIVDTVSRDGKHVITDIWKYHFVNANGVPFLYDYTELLSYDDPQAQQLKEYTLKVIDALGIRWGPAHPEIMLTEDGPIVIEVGARLAGANFPLYAGAASNSCQADVAADAYCDPESFELARRNPYSLNKQCVLVSLISSTSGRLKRLATLPAISQLPSFYMTDLWVHEGELLHKTVDVPTAPGIVALLHEDPTVLQRDRATIRGLEATGLYEVEPLAGSISASEKAT